MTNDATSPIRKGFSVDGGGVVESVLPHARAFAVRVGPRHVRLIRFGEVERVDAQRQRVSLRRVPGRFAGDLPRRLHP